jgi:hypothetical protein
MNFLNISKVSLIIEFELKLKLLNAPGLKLPGQNTPTVYD